MTFTYPITLPDSVYDYLIHHRIYFEYGFAKFQYELPELKARMSQFCNNNPSLSIGDSYIDDVFEDIQTEPAYDIIFVLYGETTTVQNIVGFMVTQIGECTKPEFERIPALNLICVSKEDSVKSLPTAKTLLFLYTYTLKTTGFSYGLLELAHNYANIGGLKSYSKFGFRETLSLKLNCFDFFLKDAGMIKSSKDKIENVLTKNDTLPMIVELTCFNVSHLTDALIDNIYITTDTLTQLDPLCLQKTINKSYVSKRRRLFIQILNIIRLPEHLQRDNKVRNGIPENVPLGVLLDTLSNFAQNNEKIHFVQYTSPPRTRSRKRKAP